MLIDNFEIFENETVISLTERIADSFGSIPKFLFILGIFKQGTSTKIADEISAKTLPIIKAQKSVRIDVWDLYSETKAEAQQKKTSFEVFYKKWQDRIIALGVLVDFVFIWSDSKISEIKTRFRHFGDFSEFEIENMFGSINIAIPTIHDIVHRNELYNKLDEPTILRYIDNLKNRIQTNSENAQRIVTGNNIRNSIKGVDVTPFEAERTKIVWKTDISGLTIYEVFDAVVLSANAPFASIDKFYKVQKGFRINEEWIKTSKDRIVIKFFSTPLADPTDIFMYLTEDGFVDISAEVEVGPHLKNPEDTMLNFIKTLLPALKFAVSKMLLEDISGVVYVPKQRLDTYVFEHLVLINEQFSSFFIDESEKASKSKSGVYTYFDLGGGNLLSLLITPKTMDKYDPTMRNKPADMFPERSPYLRVKVSNARTMEDINLAISTLSKCITLYNNQYEGVIKIYNKYIPNFGKQQEDVEEEEEGEMSDVDFKKIDRELFSGNYKRLCQKPPIIVDKRDVEKYSNTMLYPKTPEEGTQRYYTCETRKDEYKYIGLQHLKKEASKYRYIPCCFKENQEYKRGSKYNEYFNPTSQPVKKKQQRVVTGGKFLNYNVYGTFDEFDDLKTVMVDPDPDYKYFRWGTDDKNRFSFLQCVVEALEYKGYSNESEPVRKATLKKIVAEIADDTALLSVAKQSLYDRSISDIRKILLSDDENISPMFFRDLLEVKFGCKIIVFGETTMEESRAARGHIQNNIGEDAPVVMIFQHWGNDITTTPYPKCELVVRANVKNTHVRSFVFDQTLPFVSTMLKVKDMTENARYGKSIIRALIIPDGVYKLASQQIINSFGKMSGLVTKDGFLFFMPRPSAPLALKETRTYVVKSLDETVKYCKDIFGKDVKLRQCLNNGIVVAVEVVHGRFRFFIPVERQPTSETLDVGDYSVVIPNLVKESMMIKFLKSQKIAKYLREYVAFEFSNFLKDNKIDSITESVIAQFATEKMVISPSVNYRLKSIKFSENDFKNSSGKILIKSAELQKRLVYALRVDCSQHSQDIFEYHTKSKARHFIIDMTDFDSYPNQIILEGKDSVAKYVSGNTLIHTITNKINEYASDIYFFSNSLVGESVYIAIAVESLEQAYAYVHNWKTKRIITEEGGKRVDTDILLYKDNDKISFYRETGSENKIIGYLLEDSPAYTVLLRFY